MMVYGIRKVPELDFDILTSPGPSVEPVNAGWQGRGFWVKTLHVPQGFRWLT
jgi:hypothetical protein